MMRMYLHIKEGGIMKQFIDKSLPLTYRVVIQALVIIILFSLLLYFVVEDRSQDHYQYHHNIAQDSSKKVALEVEKILKQKKLLVKIFLEDNKPLVDAVIQDPENDEPFAILDNKLKRYFFDYISSNIANDQGKLIRDQFDGMIGEICIQDIRIYVETNKQNIRIHPNLTFYHYDVLSDLPRGSEMFLFLATFSADELASLLHHSVYSGHQLYLVYIEKNYLIEVGPKGSRLTLTGRDGFTLTQEEQKRILALQKVEGTNWHVIDLYDTTLFSTHESGLIKNSLIVFIVFSLLILFMSGTIMTGIKNKERLQYIMQKQNLKIKTLNKSLKILSVIDPLTGMYNRRYLDTQLKKRLNEARRLNKPLSVAMIDIDFFKQYNDLYGHQEGDNCLVSVSQLIQESFRRSNEWCARYGGEEFIIMNLGDDKEALTQRLHNLLQLLHEKHIEHKGSSITNAVTLSIGLASTDSKVYKESKDLVGDADKALYQAKEQGRNQIVVWS